MPVSPGDRFGPYEILAPLGAGGMGEVYRARDPRMGREVAIKVSAEQFSDRFDREVRAVAALNHPNICHIYDVGPNFLVMELVEGPTLAERIDNGAIPLEEALRIAHQIGDGLEAAHEKGIIHRDLKPANIKLKPDGGVKVLDFGLAKIAEQAAAAGSPVESPTVALGATIAGQIMGTAAYMAPEQARGKTVDKRADIWAFGVVLYEMLTGRRMFDGETISDVLAGVLTREPDLTRVPTSTRRLLRSCLEKDPKRRLRDIGDASRLLEDVPATPAPKSGALWKAAAVVLVASLVIAGAALWRATRVGTPLQPLVRVDIDLGPDVSVGSSIGPAAVLSPDGTRIVFVSKSADRTSHLFMRRIDQPKATPMPGTEGAYTPFFSPDGRWVAFFAHGKLKKARIDDSVIFTLSEAYAARGGSWGEDGNIVAALDPQTPISQIPADGGKPVAITDLRGEVGEFSHRWPQSLPGGKAVLFTASNKYANFEGAAIAVLTLKDRRRKTVLEPGGMFPRYLPTGHLTYVAKGALYAVPFDLERLEVRGTPVKLLDESLNYMNLGFAQLDFSRSGALLYLTGKSEEMTAMQWVDAAGKTTPFSAGPAHYVAFRLSPEGNRIAVMENEGASSHIYVYDWQRGIKSQVSKDVEAGGGSPVWSPDGRFVVFESPGGIFCARADGAGRPQSLTRTKNLQVPSSFSPDGTRLTYTELIPGAAAEIRIVTLQNSAGELHAGEPELFVKTSTVSSFPAFSHDGRWIAYSSAEGGMYEVYVRAFPPDGRQWQISSAGGVLPVWSRNGHELFYRTEDQRIMLADYVAKGGSFEAGKPRLWFARPLASVGLASNFDLAPDGKHFLVLMTAGDAEPREAQNHVMLALNFFDEVRRRVAVQAK
jgi:serine/threonine-protein kinase